MFHIRFSSFREALFFLSSVIFPFTVLLLNSQARCSTSLSKRAMRFPYGAEDLVKSGITETPHPWTSSRLYPTATQPLEGVRAKDPEAKRWKSDTLVRQNSESRSPPRLRNPNHDSKKFKGPMKALKVDDLPIKALSITPEKEDLRKSIQTALDKLAYNFPSLKSIKLDSPPFKHLEMYELRELEYILKGLQAQLELGQSQQLQIQKRLDELSRKLEASSQSSQLAHNGNNINAIPVDYHTPASQSTEQHSRMEIIMSKLNQFIQDFDANFEADSSLIYADQHQYSTTLNEIFEIIQGGKKISTRLDDNTKYISIAEKEKELKKSLKINQEEWKSIQEATLWIRSSIPTYKNAQNALRSKASQLDSWYKSIQKKAR